MGSKMGGLLRQVVASDRRPSGLTEVVQKNAQSARTIPQSLPSICSSLHEAQILMIHCSNRGSCKSVLLDGTIQSHLHLCFSSVQIITFQVCPCRQTHQNAHILLNLSYRRGSWWSMPLAIKKQSHLHLSFSRIGCSLSVPVFLEGEVGGACRIEEKFVDCLEHHTG